MKYLHLTVAWFAAVVADFRLAVLEARAQALGLAGVLMDGRSIPELQARLVELNDMATALQLNADKADRELSIDEQKEIDGIFDEFERIEQDIERRQKLLDNSARLATPQQRPTGAAPEDDDQGQRQARQAPPANQGGVQTRYLEPRGKREAWGWNSLGEFAIAAKNGSRAGGHIDNRLEIRMAPTTYGSEGVGEDGGFAVPPEFRSTIMEKVLAEENLISRTDQLTSSSNSITLPVDETTQWQTSGGIQAYWEGEADQLTQSKPQIKENSIRLNKLTALVAATSELLDDAPAISTYLQRKAPEKISFKVNRAIFAGTGAGQPLGILNSPAKIAVAKESGQAADTIVAENVVNMYSRMYAPCVGRSIWIANQDTLPQLLTMNFEGSGGAIHPVFLPPGGLADSPFGRLMGRPLVFSEVAETLGDEGDLVLADMNQYMTATKVGGIRAETSMHLWFDYDTMAFRFILRIAGQPWWQSPITPRASANTLSCFVTLAARA